MTVDIPTFDVQIRGKDAYIPLTNMRPVEASYEDGIIRLALQSFDRRVQIAFKLDFIQERLHFDLSEDLFYHDDGTYNSAEAIADVKRFFGDYFSNGHLQIYNSETRELVSRKDAYIPVNMMLDSEASQVEIDYWKRLAALRRQRTERVENEIIQWSDPYFLSVALSFTLKARLG